MATKGERELIKQRYMALTEHAMEIEAVMDLIREIRYNAKERQWFRIVS